MRKWITRLVVTSTLIVAGIYWAIDKDLRQLLVHLPTDTDVLFWSTPQRDAAFRAMDRLPMLAPSNIIRKGNTSRPLPDGAPLEMSIDVEDYMRSQRSAALIVVQGGRLRIERYSLGFGAKGRWTSFSVAKSMTSTLVGAAIKDGYIDSVDDKVSRYIRDLRGSVYDDVSIRQLLTMTSGVRWNEDYSDPNSDVARFATHTPEPGVDATVSYMRELPREAPAGSKWVYKTGETNLIGVLVTSATGKGLAEYLSEKIWVPFGMEQDASWLLGSTDQEIGGCCVQAATRDFARMGLFMLAQGRVNGQSILPEDWVSAATTRQVSIGMPGRGYGYQWWTHDDGSYEARGIFGQGIFIDPARDLVIASNSNWPHATERETLDPQRAAFYKAIQTALDTENTRRPPRGQGI